MPIQYSELVNKYNTIFKSILYDNNDIESINRLVVGLDDFIVTAQSLESHHRQQVAIIDKHIEDVEMQLKEALQSKSDYANKMSNSIAQSKIIFLSFVKMCKTYLKRSDENATIYQSQLSQLKSYKNKFVSELNGIEHLIQRAHTWKQRLLRSLNYLENGAEVIDFMEFKNKQKNTEN